MNKPELQYNQYSNLLMGADRRIWHELFEDMSDGGLKDARKFGFRVVVLGGTPTIEPAPVKQASNIQEMLQNALELESALVQAYESALEVASDNTSYRTLLEDQVKHEHDEVEELQIYLGQVQKQQVAAPVSRRQGQTG
jgi:bacterioferritin